MNSRTIGCPIVNDPARREICQNRSCTSYVHRITMAEEETIETIDAAGVQGAPQDFFVIAAAAGIKEPIGASRTNVHRSTRTKVQHGDLHACAGRPLRSRDVHMATGE